MNQSVRFWGSEDRLISYRKVSKKTSNYLKLTNNTKKKLPSMFFLFIIFQNAVTSSHVENHHRGETTPIQNPDQEKGFNFGFLKKCGWRFTDRRSGWWLRGTFETNWRRPGFENRSVTSSFRKRWTWCRTREPWAWCGQACRVGTGTLVWYGCSLDPSCWQDTPPKFSISVSEKQIR